MLLYGAVDVLWRLPPWAALWYGLASAVTFVVYASDKQAAETNARRTSEKHLHLLALLGGWPGALLAQQLRRHKSTKAEFRARFWWTVAANIVAFLLLCALWVGLLAPRGP